MAEQRAKALAVYPFCPYPPNFGGRIRCWHLLRHLGKVCRVKVAALTTLEDDGQMLKRLGREGSFESVRGMEPAPRPELTKKDKLRNILSPTPWEVPIRSKEMEDYVARTSLECDVLYVFSPGLMHLGKLSRARVNVIDVDDIEHLRLLRKIRFMEGVKARAGYTLELLKTAVYELKGLAGFNEVFVCSELDRKRLGLFNRRLPVTVVPNGVDLDYFTPAREGDSERGAVLFVGALDFPPNILAVKWLVGEIFPIIRARVPGARLLIVGRNPQPEVTALAGGEVEVFGNVSDVRPFFSRCEVVVSPIVTGAGTRIKILEAAASARPVVSTSMGAEGLDLVPEREILIADTAEDFAKRTAELLFDRDRALGLAEAARARVERDFSWDKSGERLRNAILGRLR